MTARYKINEIFYSLQGEGYHVGTPAVFIRFSGCNLRCPFCDTAHEDGRMMTDREILDEISKYPSRHVVLTGGEPSLFIDSDFVQSLHGQGRYVAVETNGTHPLPAEVDWITCSPKVGLAAVPDDAAKIRIARCDELKVVYVGQDMSVYESIQADHHFLQPCDTGDSIRNAALITGSINYCKSHPKWRLSLQTHKLLDIK